MNLDQLVAIARFSPAVEARFQFKGSEVVETLERVGQKYGLPKVIRVDQGSEFVSRDLEPPSYRCKSAAALCVIDRRELLTSANRC